MTNRVILVQACSWPVWEGNITTFSLANKYSWLWVKKYHLHRNTYQLWHECRNTILLLHISSWVKKYYSHLCKKYLSMSEEKQFALVKKYTWAWVKIHFALLHKYTSSWIKNTICAVTQMHLIMKEDIQFALVSTTLKHEWGIKVCTGYKYTWAWVKKYNLRCCTNTLHHELKECTWSWKKK